MASYYSLSFYLESFPITFSKICLFSLIIRMFDKVSWPSFDRIVVRTKAKALKALSTDTWLDGVACTTAATALNSGCVFLRSIQNFHTSKLKLHLGSTSIAFSCWLKLFPFAIDGFILPPPKSSASNRSFSFSSVSEHCELSCSDVVVVAVGLRRCLILFQVSTMYPWKKTHGVISIKYQKISSN